jgi:hypothetical protein
MAKEAFTFKCSSCGAMLAGKRSWSGRSVRCNKCNAVITVPQPAADERAPEAASPAPGEDTSVHKVAARFEARDAAVAATAGQGLLQVFPTLMRWLTEGIEKAVRSFVPLLLGVLLADLLCVVAMALAFIPAVFVVPAVTVGFVLLLVDVARGRKGSAWTILAPFANGLYWRSVGVFWMTGAILAAVLLPAAFCLAVSKSARVFWGPGAASVAVVIASLLVLVAMYLASRIIFAIPLSVDRRLPAVESFRQSWLLTGRIGRGWGVFALLLIIKVMGLAVNIIFAFAAYTLIIPIADTITSVPRQVSLQELPIAAVSPFTAAVILVAFLFMPLVCLVAAVLSVPLLVGYRESVPH